MNVILLQNVANLGQTGDTVKVKDGFGRNFLVPRGLAVIADERNSRRMAHLKRQAEAAAAKEISAANELAEKVNGTAVSIKREAGEEGKIFGSVTNRDIAEALAAEGVEIDRRSIIVPEPIRNIGVFNVDVKLHREIQATVKVYVIQG
jgi:large subunit ribosomal protein L9